MHGAMPELLAPAGSSEALCAALRCGADAVYLGAERFSARQNAHNFDLPALREAATLCHLYGAKLYLTLNTLLFDSERAAFCALMTQAAEAGVDAFIMQDLGAIALARQLLPDLPVHGSTQMSIHTPAGVAQAKSLGIKRVVAARELSAQGLSALCETGAEIEVFCHGALCMSCSGQCYLSAMIGSRSANRGLCAQACRLPFSASGSKGACALSLRDLCLVEQLKKLQEIGVASLKIEGRMKRPEYVAAAVTAFRAALSGAQPDLAQLQAVFSRSGFTDGYFTDERRNMFGVRAKEDVLAAKDALPALAQLYRKPRKAATLSAHLTAVADKPATLTLSDDCGNEVSVCGEIPQIAQTAPLDAARLTRQLEKLGDTIYTLGDVTCDVDGALMLPASALNALRRDGTAALDTARIRKNTPVWRIADVPALLPETPHADKPTLRVQAERAAQLAALSPSDCDFVLLPIAECRKTNFPPDRVIVTLPRMMTDEGTLTRDLAAVRADGFSRLLCSNLAHVSLGEQLGFMLHGDFGLNATNSDTLAVLTQWGLADVTLSFELKLSQMAARRGELPCGAIAYGRLPLMLTRLCPVREEVGCANCTHQLTDRTDRSFPLDCHGDHVELLNAEPLYLADRLPELAGLSFLTLLLHDESAAETAAVVRAYQSGCGEKPAHYTRGLYYRGVL